MHEIFVSLIILFCALSSTALDIHSKLDIHTGEKIIGGEQAVRHEFPWIVDFRKFWEHTCTGSIVTEEWIATAAHCIGVEFEFQYYFNIVAGDHNIDSNETTEQFRNVARVVVHPEYEVTSGHTFKNDIALIQVSRPFVFNEFVQPAIFAARGWVPEKSEATVAGWGSTSQLGNYQSRLMKVMVPLKSDNECASVYGQDSISDSMICAGGEEKDFCVGDSGSPLMCQLNSGITVICGISSWGRGCGSRDYPGVYSEISHFSDWIYRTVVPQTEDNSTWVEQNEGCGGILVGSSGQVTYKGQLQPNERCSWTIRANDKDTIRIEVLEYLLDASDFLTINAVDYRRGQVSESSGIVLTGDSTYTLQGPVVFLSLYTQNSNSIRNGFTVRFQGLGYAIIPEFQYSHFHFSADLVGSFAYPGNGSNYKNKEMVTFVIHPSISFSSPPNIQTTIDVMDLEPNYVCWYDAFSLHIYSITADHRKHGYQLYPSVNQLCGHDTAQFFNFGGMTMLLLKTDFSNTRSGFNFSWTIA